MQQPFAQRARTNSVRARLSSLVFFFVAALSLAWPGLAAAAPSTHCPAPIAMTVPHGGSASVPGIGLCDGPFDSGLGFIATNPINGSATMVVGNQDVIYSHSGNGATSDTFVVNDGDLGEVTVNVTIQAPTSSIVVSPSGGLSMRAGQNFSQQFIATGGSGGYTWAGATLPNGLSITAGGLLSGVPTQRGSVTFSLTVTDSSLATKTQSYTLTIADPIITLSPTPVQRVVTRATTITFTPSGGVGSYAYPMPNTPVSGTLPPGMTLANNVLSGTPSTIGTYNFSIEVRDSSTGLGSFSAQVPVQVQITAAPVIVVSPAGLSGGTAGVAYSQTVTATGGANPHALSWTGTPPPGLTLNAGTGDITGTPTQTGTFNFNVTGTDNDGFTGTRAYNVTIAAPTITLPAASLTAATRNVAYTAALPTASGGNAPYTYSIVAGALPPGLTLNGVTAQLGGTPSASGTFNFTVSARDSTTGGTYTGTQSYALLVTDLPPVANPVSATVAYGSSANPLTLNITGAATSVAVAMQAVHGTATATGTSITYTPTAGYGGPDAFTYTATNSQGTSAPATITITVSPPSVNLAPAGPIAAQAGQAFSQVFTITGGAAPYNISVSGLPPGLSVTGVTGNTVTVSGTPTHTGSMTLTFIGTDSSTGTGPYSINRPVTLNVAAPALSLSPAPGTLNGTYGQAYSQAFTASGGNGTYTYSLTGTLPVGLSFNAATGGVSGTSAQVGSFPFTIHAIDQTTGAGAPYMVSQNYLVTMAQPTITIAPVTMPTPVIGVAYSQTLTASGGLGGYTYSLSSGILPVGISLSSAGTLSGTPTTPGVYSITVAATDSNGWRGSHVYGLLVSPPSLVLSPAPGALPQATGSQPYTQSFTTTGGLAPYTYSLRSGALPVGMSFSSAGVLSGTPAAAGSFTFTVRTTDSTGGTPTTLDQPYSVNVVSPTLTVTPTAMNAVVGTPFSATMTASGGRAPYQYSIRSGVIPPGVAISSAGVVSGVPVVAGTYTADMRVRDGFGFESDYSLSFVVADATPVASNDSASTLVNQPVSIDVAGNDSGIITSVAVQAAPSHGTVTVSGMDIVYTPAANYFGTDSFTYAATGPGGTSAPATVTIAVMPVLSITPAAGTLTGAYGQSFHQTFTASGSGGPYTYAIAGDPLPAGLSFDTASGTLAGTPTQAGTYSIDVRATDQGAPYSIQQSYTLQIAAPTIAILPATLPAPSVGVAYSQTFSASGGLGAYTYSLSAGTLPVGVSLSSAGVLSGTSIVPGSYNLTITATDTNGMSGSQAYSFTIGVPVLAMTPASGALPQATGSHAYTQAFIASNGFGPYAYSLVSGALPVGMSFNSAGVLTGTPRSAGTFNFTVRATDSTGGTPATLDQAYSLTVLAPAIVFTPGTVNAVQGTPLSATLTASGGQAPYSYSLLSGALPTGVALSSAGTISGTPQLAGTHSLNLRVSDTNGFSSDRALTIMVGDAVPVATNDSASTLARRSVTIDVTDNDTGVITGVAVQAAPSHGTVTVSGTDIVYTPTADFFGTDSFTYVASAPGGTSAPATVTVTVNSLPVPVAHAQTATVLAGETVTIDATAGATGGPYTAAAVVTAPSVGTVVVTGTVLAFTPPMDAQGDIAFTYTLTNAFGTSTPATVTVTVNPMPTAPAHHADAIAATSVQVELTDGATGGPFTAATLLAVMPAAAGTARIDASGSGASARYRLTFTAAADFDGIARIGYTLTNAFATSAPGSVEVQVQSRPDPTLDPEVTGLLAAQAAAARRFATAQIGNFQQRLENLHRGDGSGGFRNNLSLSADRRCQDQPRRLPGSDCAQQALNDEAAAQEASLATDGEGRSGNAGQIGIWTGGAINRGDRDAVNGSSGFDFETSGVSAGADYRVNRAFAIGGGLGYGRDDSDIGHDGTRSEADSYNLAVYASYHPGEVFFLDGLFGYQWLSYDLRRHVTANGGQVLGERDGTQWFGSLSLGAELRRERLQVAPYVRWDMARGTLDGYTETGDDVFALRYADQEVNTSTGNLGLRIDYRIPTTFGSIAPQFRLEYQHDFQDDGSATMSYADMLSGPFYRADVKGMEQNRFVFGIGAVLQTERDFSVRLEYRGLFQSNNDSDHGVLLNLEKKY